jgi:hypothetical protein
MADTKISALTAATTPLAGTEVLPIVQGGATVKVAVSNLTAGRAVATAGGPFTDNIVQSTAAKGVNFTANTPTAGMTSQLLNWYEEGTWTPILLTDDVGFTSVSYDGYRGGRYIRVGKVVHIQGYMATTSVTIGSATGSIQLGGLPFTSVASSGSTLDSLCGLSVGNSAGWAINSPSNIRVQPSGTVANLYYRAVSGGGTTNIAVLDVATSAGNFISFGGTYICA